MSQRLKSVSSRSLPEHLITGDRPAGDERLIGADTGLAAVMARARIVVPTNPSDRERELYEELRQIRQERSS